MNRVDHRTLPDRFELEAQAHIHRTSVAAEAVHAAAVWFENHLREVAHSLSDDATPRDRTVAH